MYFQNKNHVMYSGRVLYPNRLHLLLAFALEFNPLPALTSAGPVHPFGG